MPEGLIFKRSTQFSSEFTNSQYTEWIKYQKHLLFMWHRKLYPGEIFSLMPLWFHLSNSQIYQVKACNCVQSLHITEGIQVTNKHRISCWYTILISLLVYRLFNYTFFHWFSHQPWVVTLLWRGILPGRLWQITVWAIKKKKKSIQLILQVNTPLLRLFQPRVWEYFEHSSCLNI